MGSRAKLNLVLLLVAALSLAISAAASVEDTGEQLFQEAVTATANDPVFRNHVRRAYAEVLWAGVMLDLKPTTGTQAVILPAADAAAVRAKAKLFGEIMRENGYDKLAEWLPYVPGDNLIDSAARE